MDLITTCFIAVGETALEMAVPLFWLGTLAGSTDAKYSYAKLLQIGKFVPVSKITSLLLVCCQATASNVPKHPYVHH